MIAGAGRQSPRQAWAAAAVAAEAAAGAAAKAAAAAETRCGGINGDGDGGGCDARGSDEAREGSGGCLQGITVEGLLLRIGECCQQSCRSGLKQSFSGEYC